MAKELDEIFLIKKELLFERAKRAYKFVSENKNWDVQSKIIYLTSFDSGYWAIPPFQFRLEEDTSVFYTEPLLLSVGSIAVDTTLAIKDIKQPFDQSYNWLDWLKDNMYVVYGSLLAILLILLIIYLVRRFYKIKPAVVILEVPKIPAHIIAIQKLDELKNEKIWQQAKLSLEESHCVIFLVDGKYGLSPSDIEMEGVPTTEISPFEI